MSKLDELMALVDKHADAHHHDECGHFPEGASRPLHAALQDALKAVVEDAQLARAEARALSEALDRTWHVLKKHGKHPGRTDDTIWDCVDAAIDAARKP